MGKYSSPGSCHTGSYLSTSNSSPSPPFLSFRQNPAHSHSRSPNQKPYQRIFRSPLYPESRQTGRHHRLTASPRFQSTQLAPYQDSSPEGVPGCDRCVFAICRNKIRALRADVPLFPGSPS